MNLTDILSVETIKVPLRASEKRAAIGELVDALASAGKVSDADKLKDVVWEREQQRTTGIGEGLAIPHGKSNCSKDLVMAVGVASSPIEFQSVDRKPVHMIVLLASPPDKTADHIQALGKISRLMSDAGFRARAFAVKSAEELYGLFKGAEG